MGYKAGEEKAPLLLISASYHSTMASRTAVKIQWHIFVKTLYRNTTALCSQLFPVWNSIRILLVILYSLPWVVLRQHPPARLPFWDRGSYLEIPSCLPLLISPLPSFSLSLLLFFSPRLSLPVVFVVLSLLYPRLSRLLGLGVILSYLGVFILFLSFCLLICVCQNWKEKKKILFLFLTDCLTDLPALLIPNITGASWMLPRSCAISVPNVLPLAMFLTY